MEELFKGLRINVDANIYVKDPYSSELGKQILSKGVPLLLELGLEGFTFKKLAEQINTTEGAIYRYFENKHKLLLYLYAWYWGWMEYQLMFRLSNVDAVEEKLDRILHLLVNGSDSTHHDMINVQQLRELMIEESIKTYFTKEVNEQYKRGFFGRFQRFVSRLSAVIAELNPSYPYPNSLAITLLDAVFQQEYYQKHLPFLSDLSHKQEKSLLFYKELVLKTIAT